MKVVATSDFHGCLPETVEPCDILIVAGDFSPATSHALWLQRSFAEWELKNWLMRQPAQTIIGICGNHDFIGERDAYTLRSLPWLYLEDQTVEVQGYVLHASPYVPTFYDWAFMKDDHKLAEHWANIPDDCDILVTHGPPLGIRDRTPEGDNVGSQTLRDRIRQLPNLKLHVFGHIHDAYGSDGIHHNVSYVNEEYKPANQPMVFNLEDRDTSD